MKAGKCCYVDSRRRRKSNTLVRSGGGLCAKDQLSEAIQA